MLGPAPTYEHDLYRDEHRLMTIEAPQSLKHRFRHPALQDPFGEVVPNKSRIVEFREHLRTLPEGLIDNRPHPYKRQFLRYNI